MKKILLLFVMFMLASTVKAKSEELDPCAPGFERYFISYSVHSKDAVLGFGRTIMCTPIGEMDTANGIIKIEKQMSKDMKNTIVLNFFQKLKQ